MNDEFLKYYNRELTYIRRLGADFAEKYPKIAGRLKISDETIEDPHVSRLVESFSFLTAQIRQKLDDSFPELTDALLGQLYPDYQAPIPSMAIVKMTTQNLSTDGYFLKKGNEIETLVDGLKSCTFETCYDTKLWPVDVTEAEFKNAPFNAPKSNSKTPAKAVVKLNLACEFDNTEFGELGMESLRFYLNGQKHHVYPLYELICRHTLEIGIAPKGEPEKMRRLLPRHLTPVGFDDDQQVLPYSNRSLPGYRLLAEQFLFPEKFLFFELKDLDPRWQGIKDQLEIYLYLAEGSEELERHVTADNLLLGCTPVINLFKQNLEPIRLEPSQYEYRLVPHYQDADVCEVISLVDVDAFDPYGNKVKLNPFYAQGHPNYLEQDQLFWHTRREFSDWAGGYSESGTEVFLSIVDRKFKGTSAQDQDQKWVIQSTALCSNRNLPSHLPFGGGEPRMAVKEHADLIKEVRCLSAPSATVRPALHENTRWQLVNHLSLNHFTGEGALDRLKETLRLYDFKCAPENKALIDGISALEITPGTARVNQNGRVAICSGSNILVEFTESAFAGSGIYFFSCILDAFFSQYAAINSFTRLAVKFRGQDNLYHEWDARIGRRPLL
ncbi:type VI secretion system baseplate subunit TssF [Litoribrevibacter albus]|uniref:Type VI secretion system protein ImpG n=1 Tax=Litoribrevibacter albus TaxID=1473156 RepID=A0AA37W8U0_9GAMM|nr:type VI secretion system baseplate subunit TssF [Litoribrevibacter albus]GLQ31856.1 type VI secretion system protein ImpG [Litoribrevibacter albus]